MADRIDQAGLSGLYGGDQDMISLLLDRFVTKFQQEGADPLLVAVESGVMDEIRRQAHNLKTSTLMICAGECAKLAHDVEMAAIAGNGAEIARLAPQVEAELKSLVEELKNDL